jgi:AcrR family transcriptional regulator
MTIGRPRIQHERQARMELVLSSAEKLFVEKGYHETSIGDIAETADFSRTSIYQYFGSKEEIYVHLLERYTDLLIERATEAVAKANNTIDKIKAFLEAFRQVMKLKPNFFELYFIQRHELERLLSSDLRTRLNQKRRVLENVFRGFYAAGAAKGEVRDLRAKDASNLFFAQVGGMLLLHTYYGAEFDVTIDQHLDQSLQMYLEFVRKADGGV